MLVGGRIFLVAFAPNWDLLLCAKHLFVTASRCRPWPAPRQPWWNAHLQSPGRTAARRPGRTGRNKCWREITSSARGGKRLRSVKLLKRAGLAAALVTTAPSPPGGEQHADMSIEARLINLKNAMLFNAAR